MKYLCSIFYDKKFPENLVMILTYSRIFISFFASYSCFSTENYKNQNSADFVSLRHKLTFCDIFFDLMRRAYTQSRIKIQNFEFGFGELLYFSLTIAVFLVFTEP